MSEDGVYQVLDPAGKLREGAKPALDDEFVLEALRWMILSRAFDAKATALQRQGRFGVFSPVLGQEAAVVGSAMAFDPKIDWLVPQYRELPAYLMWGLPLSKHILNLSGNPVAGRIPDDVKMLPTQVALAAQLPHAVGIAWGLKIQGKEGAVVTYLGEGASSEGDFHEACNLAGVTGSPIVFFLQNNQWAISTPRAYQSAARQFSDRAAGYGFPGRVVDGNDLLAVYEVTKEAVDRARRGDGPTLIEAVTYRMSFHNTTDNPSRYQDPKDLDEARQRDPIDRVEAYLRERGLWSEETEREFKEAAAKEIDDAVADAQKAPPPQPSQIFDNVYSDLSPRLARQRDEMLGRLPK
ncbi:MAG TPA: pyruvate dehydrogenase (acetyl-transferring) E1 component subunit alpha [Candidatus Dormibacteraeota bacterium]|nr:pyruvate dehydrogenase (acetyl-transferring) E1 component subunit alpha [Candidatus Dormibacteraeota bacterium]